MSARRSILSEDPRGRCDIALVRMGELLVRNAVEPACGGVRLWDGGVGELVEAYVVEQLGVPTEPVTLVEIARNVGILKPRRRSLA